MSTRRPIRPIKEVGVQIDHKAEAARKRYEEEEVRIYYAFIIVAYPFMRAYWFIKDLFRRII
jgi:hypothetical protein